MSKDDVVGLQNGVPDTMIIVIPLHLYISTMVA